jgi:hypothetical protein
MRQKLQILAAIATLAILLAIPASASADAVGDWNALMINDHTHLDQGAASNLPLGSSEGENYILGSHTADVVIARL